MEKIISSTNGAEPYAKEWYWTLKINLAVIKELNVRAKTLILWKENIDVNPQDLGSHNGFLDKSTGN